MTCCSPTKKIVILICLWKLNIVYCTDNNMTNLIMKPPSTPRHRGAARQIYGSGSLRPKDSRPIYATGQRNYGERSTIGPDISDYQIIQKTLPYPIVPYPYDLSDLHPLPEVLGGFRSSSRSGLSPRRNGGIYNDRPEYHSGRPKDGIIGGKYPFDLGQIIGRGFDRRQPSYDVRRYKIGQYDEQLIQKSDDKSEMNPQCGFLCNVDEYLCAGSCDCIKVEARCDGEYDCKDGEDELNCYEYEYKHVNCDEKQNKIRCPRTDLCISKEWLCDGDDDCGDFSDETHCGHAKNCTADQFECSNGLCIPKQWVCDNDVDCKDFSDEFNCTQTGCKTEEFDCDDNICISLIWKCDGQIDCVNGKDEFECSANLPDCLMDEFLCSSTHKCIKTVFKCDGDNDCGDWSDESDCDKIRQNCESGEFRCSNGRCISDRYRCDKQQDCENNEDESNCDYSINRNCSSDEFKCKSGSCILKTWVCDGFQDCTDNEDEFDCQIVCDESKYPCMKSYPDDNSTYDCINKKHVCDGQVDCPKGEDELNCDIKRECEKNTNCSQLCVTKHNGEPACSCLPGYTLAQDGINCEDINECLYATDPVCSQKCINMKGSFKCGCLTGYVLRPDLRSCKALGEPPTLLFANRKDIRQVSLSNAKYTSILKGLQNAISLDYHFNKKLIFWTDISINVIRRAFINGSDSQDVIKEGLEAPGGLAIDWIHDLLFWIDSGTQRIEVSSLDGKNRAILITNDIDKPRAIVVHPGETLIFWTDWGPFPKIEKSEMDGKNRKKIITESIFWPNGLTLDYTNDRIYWADAKHNVIESSLLDGSNRKKIISEGLPHPFAITIFEDLIFWTDWHTKSISSASKSSGVGLRTIHSNLNYPMDIHSYHSQRQPKYRSHCKKNGGCSHMCLPNKQNFTCVCRFGQKVASDEKSCIKPEKFFILARKRSLNIKYLNEDSVSQHNVAIPLEGLKSVSGFAWDSITDTIFWTDFDKKTINKANWNGSNQEVLIKTNLESPVGITCDWLTKKIYWVDSELNRIEVSDFDGKNRSLLVWDDLEIPRDIIVDPNAGLVFWATWDEKSKIERISMDGSMRKIIIKDDLIRPSGLSIDYQNKKLYWADSGAKSISMSNFDGTEKKIVLEGPNLLHPYGLDVFGGHIYWTDWENSTLEKADKISGKNKITIQDKLSNIIQLKVFHRKRKITITPCHTNNGGCSHLCLLKPNGYTCACPTGIKLKDDGKTCANGPKNYLILAHRSDIRQISLDVPYVADVVLPFPSLKMALSVDVDRQTGDIYLTDTSLDVIKRIKPDGTDSQIILMHELIMSDGICIDSTGRKIYWTDGGRNSIEVSELDGKNRKVLFEKDLDKPRAITLHYHHGLMFWSDWGKKPKIEVSNMDGKFRKVLINTNLQWPNGLAIDRPLNRLYWNDGKLNKIESCNLKGLERRIILKNVPHPYGLVIVGNHMYWTDWQTRAIHRADKTTGFDSKIIRGKLEGLMDIRAVQSDNIAENACGINNGGCSHLCLRNPTSYTCACPTGLLFAENSKTTCNTIPTAFLLISTRFALSRISLDTPEIWDYTLPINNIDDAVDVDFHWKNKLIYFSDIEHNLIKSINMNNYTDIKDVIKKKTGGISIDWISNNIYWTNIEEKVIEVGKIDGSYTKTLITERLHDPHSIVVYPQKGYLYWTDWEDAKIERSYLDGTSRSVLINDQLIYPVGLTIDYEKKRLYWIDAKLNEEKIETSNLHGQNRIILDVEKTNPFSLTQFEGYIYWTDWKQKSVYRADKSSGKAKTILRSNLDAALGVTMVTQDRQKGWNPCAIRNGECEYFCFYSDKKYSCGCPDDVKDCKKEPKEIIPYICPKDGFNCDDDDGDEEKNNINPFNNDYNNFIQHSGSKYSDSFYIISFLLMACIILLCLIFVIILLFMRGKKNYVYGHGRSFTNPNYYSSNSEENQQAINHNSTERKQFLWKRLKYDKSQERVYEETVGNSPEVVSLIPMLTPNSSKCDGIKSEIDKSPLSTPLEDLKYTDPVV